MGRAARARAEREFSAERTVVRVEAFLRRQIAATR
jgi:hypothetical protein